MKWRYENVKGGKVLSRVNASMVAIKNRLFIFGGRDKIAAKATVRRSYSIAEYDGNEWTWVATDVPYDPDDIEASYDAKAIAIYDGVKILLGPGRRRSGNTEARSSSPCSFTVDLNPDRWFVFHTRHRTFSALFPARGTLPDEANWYWMQPVGAVTDHSRSDDALVVAWIPYGTGDLVPDIWRCNMDEETISCMNIRSRVWDLDLDLHCFVACKGRFLLLGHDNVIYNEDGTQATGEDGEVVTTSIEDALYNVVVEIDVEHFTSEVKVEDA
ncbi:hypothetical protein CPB85DRAFT_1437746 [Mucidula mucida]|nr:hypothetical protein CPB85DRAFT_1437746 [Mucidula mucida]